MHNHTLHRLGALFLLSTLAASAQITLTLVETGGTFASGQTNLSLAGTAFAKDLINGDGFGVHAIANVNDGVYGNASSWIGETSGYTWVGITLAAPSTISALAFGRDNTGTLQDRQADTYIFQYSTDNQLDWTQFSSLDYVGAPPASPWLRHAYDLGTPLTGVTDIRILVYGGGLDSGTAIDEVELYAGSLSAVPEPSTYAALAGVAALGFAAWRRRRVGA